MLKDTMTLLSSVLSDTGKMYCLFSSGPFARERAVTRARFGSWDPWMGPCPVQTALVGWVRNSGFGDLRPRYQSPQLLAVEQASLFCEPQSPPFKNEEGEYIPHLVKMFLKL